MVVLPRSVSAVELSIDVEIVCLVGVFCHIDQGLFQGPWKYALRPIYFPSPKISAVRPAGNVVDVDLWGIPDHLKVAPDGRGDVVGDVINRPNFACTP